MVGGLFPGGQGRGLAAAALIARAALIAAAGFAAVALPARPLFDPEFRPPFVPQLVAPGREIAPFLLLLFDFLGVAQIERLFLDVIGGGQRGQLGVADVAEFIGADLAAAELLFRERLFGKRLPRQHQLAPRLP